MVVLVLFVLLLLLGAVALVGSWGNDSTESSQHLSLVGSKGIAQSTFVEEGMILVKGELWKAESRQGIIEKGSTVEVVEMLPGLRVLVKGLTKK